MKREAWLLPLAVLAVYVWWVAPGNEWLDAGELGAAAWTLGVSHPPAQPLHAMLGKLVAFLPFGEIAFRLSLLSALAAAATVAGTRALVLALLPERPAARIAAFVTALLVGLSPLFVEQATRPEVYAPAAALTTWATAFAVRFVRQGRAPDALAAAFGFALAVGLQPLVAGALAAAPALALAWRARARLVRLAPAALALAALALTVFAYLPLRAGAADPPLLLWDDPATAARFWRAVSAEAYGGNFAAAGLVERALAHVWLLGEGAALPLLLVGGAGLGFATLTRLRGAATLAASIALLVAATASQKVFWPENPDIHGYLAPALPLLAGGLAALIVGVVRALGAATTALGEARTTALLAAPAFLLALWGPTVHVKDGGARRGDDASRYHDATVGRVPPGPALYIAESDHALFTAMYERLVAGDRPDVALGNRALASSSWFLKLLERSRPELFVPFVDDGGRRDDLAGRLVDENLARGFPVAGEHPPPKGLGAIARGGMYVFGRAGVRAEHPEPAAPPAGYRGELGGRIARHAGFVRARFEARRGRWRQAVRAAGVEGWFAAEALARVEAARGQPLWVELPARTRVFIFAGWQGELVARDAAFRAGLGAGTPPSPQAPWELRLLHAWHLKLGGGGDEALAALGVDARLATARLFVELERPADAEAEVRAALAAAPRHEGAALLLANMLAERGELGEAEEVARGALRAHPRSARAWRLAGMILARTGRVGQARYAWELSLAYDPAQPDVAAWLDKARREASPEPYEP